MVISYVQLYKESIQDLLTPSMPSVVIREDATIGVYLQGCKEVMVESVEDCVTILQYADKRRATASTAINVVSSRSHAVVIVNVFQRSFPPGQITAGRARNMKSASIHEMRGVGKLFLVDLAGSEKQSKSSYHKTSEGALAVNAQCALK